MQNQDSTKQNQPLSSALSPEKGNNESKDANQTDGTQKDSHQTSIPEIPRPTKPSEEQSGTQTKKDRGLADFVPRKRNNESDEEGFYFPRR